MRAEAHEAFDDGGAGKSALTRLEHDRLVERFAVPAIRLADEDPQQLAFSRYRHAASALRIVLSTCSHAAITYPAQNPMSPTTTCPAMLIVAHTNCPSLMSAKLSNVYVENVVKPPRIPVSRNRRVVDEIWTRWLVAPAIAPNTRQPTTLTMKVPSGNKVPLTRSTNVDSR